MRKYVQHHLTWDTHLPKGNWWTSTEINIFSSRCYHGCHFEHMFKCCSYCIQIKKIVVYATVHHMPRRDLIIIVTSLWARWRLKSPASRFLCIRWIRHRSKKTSKLRVIGLCEGNSPVTGEFPSQRVRDAENVAIWWRHHMLTALGWLFVLKCNILPPDDYFINEISLKPHWVGGYFMASRGELNG